jgi:hypothetical protein
MYNHAISCNNLITKTQFMSLLALKQRGIALYKKDDYDKAIADLEDSVRDSEDFIVELKKQL